MDNRVDLKKDKKKLIADCKSGYEIIKKLYDEAKNEPYISTLREEYAKLIAVKLRVLLINSSYTSIFRKLGIEDKFLFNTVCCQSSNVPGNLVQSYELISIKLDKNGSFFCSSCEFNNETDLRCSLQVWLDEIVIDQKSFTSPKVSRKDVILTLADKEGGAHEDSRYSRQYYDTIFNSGYEVVIGNTVKTIQNNYYVETLYSIAYEFICSYQEHEIMAKQIYGVADNDLCVIEISYLNEGIRRNRYIHNGSNNIRAALFNCYDYMATCRYKLIFTTNYVFSTPSGMYVRRVIDNKQNYDFLFAFTLNEFSLFVKNHSKYCKINSDKELLKIDSCRKYTFSQMLRIVEILNRKDMLEKQELYQEYLKTNQNDS